MNNLEETFAGIDAGWKALFAKSRGKLAAAIAAVNANTTSDHILRPEAKNVFAAFRECPLEQLRVVLVGQDPYPNNTACGLSFSSVVGLPPSVKAILRVCPGADEVYSADLTPWASRGVLLLNLALTTIDGKSDAHTAYWRDFITELVSNLPAAIYILLGLRAQSIAAAIQPGNTILTWGHPSPLSRRNQIDCPENFIHCNCFTRVSELIPGWSWRLNTWIFTDGACKGNGKATATGAWAFYVAAINGQPTHHLTTGVLGGGTHTNNRSELLAILAALKYCRDSGAKNIVIVSDSEYAIGAATTNAVLSNADIIGPIRALVAITLAKFRYVEAHVRVAPPRDSREFFFWQGNNIADKAADGAAKAAKTSTGTAHTAHTAGTTPISPQ